MQYALLIYQVEEAWDRASEADREEVLAAHRSLQADTHAKGAFHGAVRLMGAASAATVQRNGAEESVTDGPFIETKELLVGLYVVDCETLDEAIACARRLPTFGAGGVEVRPIQYSILESGGEIVERAG